MKATRFFAAAIAALALTACGGGAPEQSATPETTPPATTAEVTTATDVTAEIQALGDWGNLVTAAGVEEHILSIETIIVDPRTDSSPEGQQAVEICQAAVEWMIGQGTADPTVRVQESDGTAFALRQPPKYSDCTEI